MPWSIYDPKTGLFTGMVCSRKPAEAPSVAGVYDRGRWRVDQAGNVVAYTPPPPPLATLKSSVLVAVDVQLAARDAAGLRAVREMMLAIAAGRAPAGAAVSALAAIDDACTTLRSKRTAITSAQTAAELQAIADSLGK